MKGRRSKARIARSAGGQVALRRYADGRFVGVPLEIEEVRTITAKGQTTVPKAVRQALGVGYGGHIAFRLEEGRVSVHAVPEAAASDPALAPFLALLEADLAVRPAEAVVPLPEALAARIETLAAEAGEVDPDAPIEGEVTL